MIITPGKLDPQYAFLCICRENTGRSQVAERLLNCFAGRILAQSAGIKVDIPGQMIGDRPEAALLIATMKEQYNLDIAHQRRTPYETSMLNEFGRIIVLAETECIPGELLTSRGVEHYPITDLKNRGADETVRIIGQIEDLAHALIDTHDFSHQ